MVDGFAVDTPIDLEQNSFRSLPDIFITHAPPWGIHDRDDRPHRGIKAFNWLIKTFKPTYHIHGHIHVYQPWIVTETQLGNTLVLNTYGFRRVIFPIPQKVRLLAD